MFKRDKIPVDMTPDGVRFRKESIEKRRNIILIGFGIITALSAGKYFFGQDKQLSTNKPTVPLTEVQKFRAELAAQTGGKNLLEDIDNTKNPKVTPEQFATTASEFYKLRKSCVTDPRILTQPHFELGITVYSEGDKDLLITKAKGLTEVPDITKFNTSLENLNTQCNTLSPYIDSGLSELVLTGKLSKKLIADPNNPISFGIEPGGYYSPRDESIHIAQDMISSSNDVFPHETMHRIVDKYKIASMDSAKAIMGESIFKKWREEGFVDNFDTVKGKKMSPELTKLMESIGLRGYSLYMYNNPNVQKFYKKMQVLKDLEKELLRSKKSISVKDKKLTLVESSEAGITKLKIIEVKKELDKLESIIPPPPEMFSTPIEIIYNIGDTRFKDSKVKAMIYRYLDIIYAKSKFEIFSPKLRDPWIDMVRAVNKSKDQKKIEQIIGDFDKQHPQLKKQR